MLGYKQDGLKGRTFADLLYDGVANTANEAPQQMAARLEQAGSAAAEICFVSRSGAPVWCRVQASACQAAPQGRLRLYVAQDISEWVSAREHLLESEEQFRQSQKMEAVGRLAGGVAHDFNNLLTIIKGYGQMSLKALDPASTQFKNLEVIVRAGDRASSLTHQLLAFSRRQLQQLRRMDLNAIVTEMEKMLRRLIGEEITLVTKLSPTLGKVLADPGQMDQVIMNLAINAHDAMPNGGKLTIETSNVELTPDHAVEHGELVPGSYARLLVGDTGVGMTQDVLKQAFEPFFTTKEPGKGTGLGLSTVYGIVKQSKGYIYAYSEPGLGTTFKIYLPHAEHAASSVESSPRRSAVLPIAQGKERILLVEDDVELRTMAAEILRSSGYSVLETSDPTHALKIGFGFKGAIDLLLSDVVMPIMRGPEIAEKILVVRKDLRVLFMTGYADTAVLEKTMLLKGAPILEKPFGPHDLLRKVRDVLDQ